MRTVNVPADSPARHDATDRDLVARQSGLNRRRDGQRPLALRRPRGNYRARCEWRGVTGELVQSSITVTQNLITTRRARPCRGEI